MTKRQRAAKDKAKQEMSRNTDFDLFITTVIEETLHDKIKNEEKIKIKAKKKNNTNKGNSRPIKYEYKGELENISDMIDMCNDYQQVKKNKKRKNGGHEKLEKLLLILDELNELNELIGLKKVKQTIFEQLLYFVQDLYNKQDMLHIQLCGKPGMGKTTLAVLLGRVLAGIGILSNGDVITATRSDLIGSHLGETSLKTSEVFNSCKGNILILDEVYSLGSEDHRDSFSKECIDTITYYLTEMKDDFICIIAGYKEDIQTCFFNRNKGLERRFPWVYELEDYTPIELREIFIKQVHDSGWSVDNNEQVKSTLNDIFNMSNKDKFSNFGGDTENLFSRCKISHSKRIFKSTNNDDKFVLNHTDLIKGFRHFIEQKQTKKNNDHTLMFL